METAPGEGRVEEAEEQRIKGVGGNEEGQRRKSSRFCKLCPSSRTPGKIFGLQEAVL